MFNLGHATDFNQFWYEKVGNSIVTTMIINLFFPFAEFTFSITLSHVLRMFDRDMTSDDSRTKQTM